MIFQMDCMVGLQQQHNKIYSWKIHWNVFLLLDAAAADMNPFIFFWHHEPSEKKSSELEKDKWNIYNCCKEAVQIFCSGICKTAIKVLCPDSFRFSFKYLAAREVVPGSWQQVLNLGLYLMRSDF